MEFEIFSPRQKFVFDELTFDNFLHMMMQYKLTLEPHTIWTFEKRGYSDIRSRVSYDLARYSCRWDVSNWMFCEPDLCMVRHLLETLINKLFLGQIAHSEKLWDTIFAGYTRYIKMDKLWDELGMCQDSVEYIYQKIRATRKFPLTDKFFLHIVVNENFRLWKLVVRDFHVNEKMMRRLVKKTVPVGGLGYISTLMKMRQECPSTFPSMYEINRNV